MDFNDQINALIFFQQEKLTSGRHSIQNLNEDYFSREHIAPKQGISKTTFFEAMNNRSFDQLLYVFNELHQQASIFYPQNFPELGQILAVDSSLIASVLSIPWAGYRKGAKKPISYIGFDISRGIPHNHM